MPKLSVKDYALHRGITWRSVYRQINEKLIPKSALSREGKGKKILVDRAKADKALDRHAMTRRDLLTDDPPPDKTTEEKIKTARKAGTASLTFHEARTLAQRFKAAHLKLDLDERTGKLVEAEAVKKAAFDQARMLRDTLLNIPDRISPVLAAESDQGKITSLLTTEIRQALEGLSNDGKDNFGHFRQQVSQ